MPFPGYGSALALQKNQQQQQFRLRNAALLLGLGERE